MRLPSQTASFVDAPARWTGGGVVHRLPPPCVEDEAAGQVRVAELSLVGQGAPALVAVDERFLRRPAPLTAPAAPPQLRLASVESVESDVAFTIAAFLWSVATSRLRAASRACKAVYVRNCACSTDDVVVIETVDQPHPSFVELPHYNSESPLKSWGLPLSSAPDALRSCEAGALRRNRGVVLATIAKHGAWYYQVADESLQDDRDVALAFVKRGGSALRFVPTKLKRDRDIVLAAVAQDGRALQHAVASLQRDRDVVLVAVAQNAWALEYADASFRRDEVVRDAAWRALLRAGEYSPGSTLGFICDRL